jgi:hypothetical protein
LHTEARKLDSPELDREWLRTCAALEISGGFASYTTVRFRIQTRVEENLHLLIVLARTTTGDTRTVAEELLALDSTARRQGVKTDRNWPLRITEIAESFGKDWSRLSDKLLDHPSFGRPEHVRFVEAMKMDPKEAARKFLASKSDWTPAKVAMLTYLPSLESRPKLKELWDQGGFEDSLIPILAKEAWSNDGPKFLVGLRSMNPEVVKLSAAALLKLEPQKDQADVIAAILALRKLPDQARTRGETQRDRWLRCRRMEEARTEHPLEHRRRGEGAGRVRQGHMRGLPRRRRRDRAVACGCGQTLQPR